MKNTFTTRRGSMALLLMIILGFAACQRSTENTTASKIQLKFHENGTFKIAQFADMHWEKASGNPIRIEETIRYVIQTEKPDLAVFTGDNITDEETKESWLKLISIMDDEKMPFAVVFGNHDAEFNLTREEMFDLLEASPYFVGEKGPEELYGVGTYALPIQASTSEKTAAVLYCMDSNDYTDTDYGYYDWFHYDQIEWYRAQSKRFTAANDNKPLPALAFFHIPLLEYDDMLAKKLTTTVGDYGEETCPGKLNTGMFATMIEMGDVMGTFCGHDHSNDFIGLEYGIALAYGRNTNGYKIGSRIIELYENQRAFNTWIRTKEGTEFLYFYPSGISPVEETGLTFLPAAAVNPTTQGANYVYYEGKFESVDELDKVTPIEKGITSNIAMDVTDKRDFAYEYHAYIKIPEKAVYYFFTTSDDGSKLFIDNKLVVNNDSLHTADRINGYVPLEAGFHDFKLRYIAASPKNSLEAGFLSKTMRETGVDEWIYLPEQ